MSVHLNLTLVGQNLVKGASVCARLRQIYLWKFTSPMNLHTSCTLFGTSILLMASTFD